MLSGSGGGGGSLRSLRLRLSDSNLGNLHTTMEHIPRVLQNLPSLVELEIELETPGGGTHTPCFCVYPAPPDDHQPCATNDWIRCVSDSVAASPNTLRTLSVVSPNLQPVVDGGPVASWGDRKDWAHLVNVKVETNCLDSSEVSVSCRDDEYLLAASIIRLLECLSPQLRCFHLCICGGGAEAEELPPLPPPPRVTWWNGVSRWGPSGVSRWGPSGISRWGQAGPETLRPREAPPYPHWSSLPHPFLQCASGYSVLRRVTYRSRGGRHAPAEMRTLMLLVECLGDRPTEWKLGVEDAQLEDIWFQRLGQTMHHHGRAARQLSLLMSGNPISGGPRPPLACGGRLLGHTVGHLIHEWVPPSVFRLHIHAVRIRTCANRATPLQGPLGLRISSIPSLSPR